MNATMLRAIFGSSAQLTSFAKTKDILNQYDVVRDKPIVVSFLASIIGGIFQTVIITPFDLVSTRLYNQGWYIMQFKKCITIISLLIQFFILLFSGVDASGRGLYYSGIVDCFNKIARTEGFFGFYKGVGANYLRLAPHSALCLVFWDVLKDVQNKYL